LFLFSGCYGKFQLTKELYQWNGSLGGRAANSAVMWIMMIVPVYAAVGAVDFFIFNTIEFWTGSNPITMGEFEHQETIVVKDTETYKIAASQNRMDISLLSGPRTGQTVSLVYNAAEESWYAQDKTGSIKVAEVREDNVLEIFNPDGSSFVYNTETGAIGCMAK